MSLHRRVARSKKGMSTIFGALFFVIIILMGFNVMLWGFVQWDSYNRVIANMSQHDQQAVAQNLIPVNVTCNSLCPTGSGTLTVIVNNLGGAAVNIPSVYIFNTNLTSSAPCRPSPCLFAPTSASANIPAGATNFLIQVSLNQPLFASNSYHITLATSMGRLFNLYYPWRFSSLIINNNGNGGQFVTNVGPLAVYFDFRSFNYTQGTQTTSQPAFCMPPGNTIIFVRVSNISNATVTILSPTMMQMQPYSANGFGQFVRAWILSPSTINPSAEAAYNPGTPVGTTGGGGNPYVLQPQAVSGPSPNSFAILKFGATAQNGGGSAGLTNTDNWLTFIGIYYLFNGQPQGETIPFMDFRTSSSSCLV